MKYIIFEEDEKSSSVQARVFVCVLACARRLYNINVSRAHVQKFTYYTTYNIYFRDHIARVARLGRARLVCICIRFFYSSSFFHFGEFKLWVNEFVYYILLKIVRQAHRKIQTRESIVCSRYRVTHKCCASLLLLRIALERIIFQAILTHHVTRTKPNTHTNIIHGRFAVAIKRLRFCDNDTHCAIYIYTCAHEATAMCNLSMMRRSRVLMLTYCGVEFRAQAECIWGQRILFVL